VQAEALSAGTSQSLRGPARAVAAPLAAPAAAAADYSDVALAPLARLRVSLIAFDLGGLALAAALLVLAVPFHTSLVSFA
jgi:hypothetical protein